MSHRLIYKGRFSLSFDQLTPDTTHYNRPDGEEAAHDEPSQSVDGLVFGYMEKPGPKYLAATVDPVVLDVPMLLDPERHCDGKGFGPSPSRFGGESARRLLVDAMRANSHQAEAILEHAWDVIGRS